MGFCATTIIYIRESIYEHKVNKISNTKEKGCYNKYGLQAIYMLDLMLCRIFTASG